MAHPKVEAMAKDFIRQLNDSQTTIEQAMEIVTAITLSVATVSNITGISTNGKFTLHIQKGSPEDLDLDVSDYGDYNSQVGEEPTRH